MISFHMILLLSEHFIWVYLMIPDLGRDFCQLLEASFNELNSVFPVPISALLMFPFTVIVHYPSQYIDQASQCRVFRLFLLGGVNSVMTGWDSVFSVCSQLPTTHAVLLPGIVISCSLSYILLLLLFRGGSSLF